MQLRRATTAAWCAILALLAPAVANAQVVDFNSTHGVFYEAPSRTNMFVYTPGGDLQVSPWDWLDVRAGWEADVVSGASVAVKAGAAYQATHPAADVVSTASVHDLRNLGRGGFTLRKDAVSVTGGFAYSTEHDYRSTSFNVAARTDTYDKNSQFEIAYARNFDQVCDLVQPTQTSNAPTRLRPLENSNGCFTSDPTRTTHPVDIDSFQGSWTQTWTPTMASQLIYTAELLDGMQSNPYRAVIIGEGLKAQEHHPQDRARESIAARLNLYLKPLRGAVHVGVRGYWDTWDIKSATLEADFEKYFGEAFRATVRGRVYKQSGALFWSDDYTGGDAPLGPRGQYWTGDRELSPFYSWMVGLRGIYTFTPSRGRILGLMTSLKLSAAADMVVFHYDEFTLGGAPITNARAYLGTFGLTALF